MRASDVIASAGTRKRLGPGLGEVCGWLWPQDCQTCGRALNGQPALYVDNYDAFAAVSLHHPRCRPPPGTSPGTSPSTRARTSARRARRGRACPLCAAKQGGRTRARFCW